MSFSYQHEYHAGNHADVLKHAVLALAIRALQKKAAPFRIYDAHAGSGIYDLRSAEAQKNAEHDAGIGRILKEPLPPLEMRDYLDVVRKTGPDRYPGSPEIARQLLRDQDQLELLELHPYSLTRLHRHYSHEPRAHIHQRDAFEGLRALVPPKEKRGIALLDSAYEIKEDFTQVPDTLLACHKHRSNGVYLLWYPLIRHPLAERFTAKVRGTGIRKILHAELRVEIDAFNGMRGSGVCIVNPPFGLDGQLNVLLPWLWQTLKNDQRSGWKVEWLVEE